MTWHSITWQYIALHHVAWHCVAFHDITRPYITSHFVTVHHMTSHTVAVDDYALSGFNMSLHSIACHDIPVLSMAFITWHHMTYPPPTNISLRGQCLADTLPGRRECILRGGGLLHSGPIHGKSIKSAGHRGSKQLWKQVMYVLLIVLEIGLGRGVSKDRFSRGRSWFGRLYVCGKYVTMYVCMYVCSESWNWSTRPSPQAFLLWWQHVGMLPWNGWENMQSPGTDL